MIKRGKKTTSVSALIFPHGFPLFLSPHISPWFCSCLPLPALSHTTPPGALRSFPFQGPCPCWCPSWMLAVWLPPCDLGPSSVATFLKRPSLPNLPHLFCLTPAAHSYLFTRTDHCLEFSYFFVCCLCH